MSIFGGAPSQQTQTTPSLFSNAQNTASQQNNSSGQPQQQTNLFGQTQQQPAAPSNPLGLGNQAQPQAAPNLFQSLSNSQAQPQTSGSSLFANLGTKGQPQQQQGGPSLFAGLGTAQSQQPQSGGSNLFGAAVTGQTQQQQPFGASLFGQTQTPQQQINSGGLFGAANGTQQQQKFGPQNNGPLFGASLLSNNISAQQQQAQAPASEGQQVLGVATAHGAYFDHLLERGKKRRETSSGNGHFAELPSLQLGLGDIASKVRHLGGNGILSKEDRDGAGRAYVLQILEQQ